MLNAELKELKSIGNKTPVYVANNVLEKVIIEFASDRYFAGQFNMFSYNFLSMTNRIFQMYSVMSLMEPRKCFYRISNAIEV